MYLHIICTVLSIVVAAQNGALSYLKNIIMQIYGIDLAKEKFDVSFFNKAVKNSSGKLEHKVVRNTDSGIAHFLDTLSPDAVLVAEHTGIYGDKLLKLCTDKHVNIAYVSGNIIHNYRVSPDREKTDELDCAVLREYGERFYDKLKFTKFPQAEIYELRQLSRHRSMLVENRKRYLAAGKGEACRPCRSTYVKDSMERMVKMLSEEIAAVEEQMKEVINSQDDLKGNYEIITSVKGVGLVTTVEIITKSNNFTTIKTARQYAAYAGTAPYAKASGKMDRGKHVSAIANRRSKTLLYTCAESARLHNKEIKLYYERRTIIDKKAHHYVLNAIANKLLRIIFTLIAKKQKYDDQFIRTDPRKN